MISQIIFCAIVAMQGQTSPVAGSISGVVVNASQDFAPVGGAEVILRVRLDGQFVVAAEGVADHKGRFMFDNIPAGANHIYLPGANSDGVHYPGTRLNLSLQKPHASIQLAVRETVSEPNPLILRRHDISVRAETGALHVTETLLIDNPSSRTYVGLPATPDGRATTLGLSIPENFRRVTFHQEFYGRQFTLFEGRLVTDIPWTPGQRELAFTYVVPNNDRHRVWERPLDLPCENLRIKVVTDSPNDVSCNLSRADLPGDGTVTFKSSGPTLLADHVVRLQLGHLPLSLAATARWTALIVLVGLIAVATGISTRHVKSKRPPARECQVTNPRKAA